MSEVTQIWYQNPDMTLVYELRDEDGELVGFGGEKLDGAVELEGDDGVSEAESQLEAAQQQARAELDDQLEAERIAEAERLAIATEAAASAYDKILSEDNPITYTPEEASVITGHWPQEES